MQWQPLLSPVYSGLILLYENECFSDKLYILTELFTRGSCLDHPVGGPIMSRSHQAYTFFYKKPAYIFFIKISPFAKVYLAKFLRFVKSQKFIHKNSRVFGLAKVSLIKVVKSGMRLSHGWRNSCYGILYLKSVKTWRPWHWKPMWMINNTKT